MSERRVWISAHVGRGWEVVATEFLQEAEEPLGAGALGEVVGIALGPFQGQDEGDPGGAGRADIIAHTGQGA